MESSARRLMRVGMAVILAAGLALTIGLLFAPASSAISPADWCTQQGGVYENVQGTKQCTYSETPGNNQGGVTKEETTLVKGNISSSNDPSYSDCVINNGGVHCN